MKSKHTFIYILLLLAILGLPACSPNDRNIEGKYVSIYDDSSYLVFDKDGSFINSLWNVTNNDKTTIDDRYIYTIDENGIITAIDTTEYEGQDSLYKYEIGILYKDYICIRWDGVFLKSYNDTTITNILGDLVLTYYLKEDKTYEYVVTSNNEILNTENGTYSISDNMLVCTREDGLIATFINIHDKVFCIEYVKE